MKLTDTAWLAGIIDGEGCISLIRVGSGEAYAATLFLDNSCIKMIDKAEQVIRDLGGVPGRQSTRAGKRNSFSRIPIHRLYLRNGLPEVLAAVAPFMVTSKRDFAESVIGLVALRPKRYMPWTEEQRTLAREIRARFMPHSTQT